MNGIPESLSARLKSAFGEFFASIEAGFCAIRPVTFRVNSHKTTAERVAQGMEECGIRIRLCDWYGDAFIAENVREDALRATPFYERGEIYLQSLSSMLPPVVLRPQAGENILDMTAAPGGKTTQLFSLSGGKALITACERDAVRFERLKFNLARQGATRVNAIKADALVLDDALKFDKILLDAPCTGTGTISPASPVRYSDGYLAKCTALQKKLIGKALKLLKKGGLLLYSTCSVLPDENDRIAEHAVRLGAKPVAVELPVQTVRLPSSAETVCICPDALYEGFYLAMFTK